MEERADPVAVVREILRRWDAGESLRDIAAPDYEAHGQPIPFQPVASTDIEERQAEISGAADLRFTDVVPGTDGRVLVEAVWSLKGRDGGAAGLVWGVFQIRDGLLASVHYFHHERDARRDAGL